MHNALLICSNLTRWVKLSGMFVCVTVYVWMWVCVCVKESSAGQCRETSGTTRSTGASFTPVTLRSLSLNPGSRKYWSHVDIFNTLRACRVHSCAHRHTSTHTQSCCTWRWMTEDISVAIYSLSIKQRVIRCVYSSVSELFKSTSFASFWPNFAGIFCLSTLRL